MGSQNKLMGILDGQKFQLTQVGPAQNCVCSLLTPRRKEWFGDLWGQFPVTCGKEIKLCLLSLLAWSQTMLEGEPILELRDNPGPSEATRISCKGQGVVFLTRAWELLLFPMKISDGKK